MRTTLQNFIRARAKALYPAYIKRRSWGVKPEQAMKFARNHQALLAVAAR